MDYFCKVWVCVILLLKITEKIASEEKPKFLPNLPLNYLNADNISNHNTKTCYKYPSFHDLKFNNTYWQIFNSSNGTFYLYGAYYDKRKLNKLPAVRILAMLNRIEPIVKTHCLFWFADYDKPVLVRVEEYSSIWYKGWANYKQGMLQPNQITCRISKQFRKLVPVSVSMVEKVCDHATNNLRVVYNNANEKEDFAVCVKGLDFHHKDISIRLIEWIELLNLLGAKKIFFHKLGVHKNIEKVLNYYIKMGRVDVSSLTLPSSLPNEPGSQHKYLTEHIQEQSQHELIPYNDCFMKNMYRYKFIVLLDVDEVIVPSKTSNWSELLKTIVEREKLKDIAYFSTRNACFIDYYIDSHGWFDDIPKYMHMLQHVYRTKNITKPGWCIKSFFDTERTLAVFNHWARACLDSKCLSYSISPEDALKHHYKDNCSDEDMCNNTKNCQMTDKSIWRYRKILIERTNATLNNLNFLTNDWDKTNGHRSEKRSRK